MKQSQLLLHSQAFNWIQLDLVYNLFMSDIPIYAYVEPCYCYSCIHWNIIADPFYDLYSQTLYNSQLLLQNIDCYCSIKHQNVSGVWLRFLLLSWVSWINSIMKHHYSWQHNWMYEPFISLMVTEDFNIQNHTLINAKTYIVVMNLLIRVI